MEYPLHLLPGENYRILYSTGALNEFYLMRNTPDKDILEPETGQIKPSYVAFQSDHLRDLSTNLLSVFQPDDSLIFMQGDRKTFFLELWHPRDETTVPQYPDDFGLDENRGAFYLKIKDLEGLKVLYNKGETQELEAVCKVLHTPVRSNYWHFSIRWFNEEGDIISQNGNWRKRMLTAARALIAEFGVVQTPGIEPLPQGLFF